jgi:hypothetical protein
MQYRFETFWRPRLSHGYYFKQCQYTPDDAPPWFQPSVFYVIYYPDPVRSIYFYCYDPYSPHYPQGAYWCRCMSPNNPDYDPDQFSSLAHPTHDIAQADSNFPPFSSTHAKFPGSDEDLPRLPPNLPN